jgi:hypothetical protein
MARQKLDPHDINRVKTQNPASLRSDCPACSGMRVQLGVESVSSFAGIRKLFLRHGEREFGYIKWRNLEGYVAALRRAGF